MRRSRARRGSGTGADRAGKHLSPVLFGGKRPAGPEVCRGADGARDRRRQHVSRIRHREPRHEAGRRGDANRRRKSLHGVRARCARLPRGEWHGFCQWSRSGRPRGHRRSCDRGRILGGASVLPGWAARLYRRFYGRHPGRVAVFEGCLRARNQMLRSQCDWAGAQRL